MKCICSPNQSPSPPKYCSFIPIVTQLWSCQKTSWQKSLSLGLFYPQSFSFLLVKSHQLGDVFIFLCPRIIESVEFSGGHHLSYHWSPIFYMKALRWCRDCFEVTRLITLKAGMVWRLILLVYLSCSRWSMHFSHVAFYVFTFLALR